MKNKEQTLTYQLKCNWHLEIHHSTWLLHPQHNNQGCGVLKVEVSSSITWLNVREFPYINDWSSCVDKGCASAALGCGD